MRSWLGGGLVLRGRQRRKSYVRRDRSESTMRPWTGEGNWKPSNLLQVYFQTYNTTKTCFDILFYGSQWFFSLVVYIMCDVILHSLKLLKTKNVKKIFGHNFWPEKIKNCNTLSTSTRTALHNDRKGWKEYVKGFVWCRKGRPRSPVQSRHHSDGLISDSFLFSSVNTALYPSLPTLDSG